MRSGVGHNPPEDLLGEEVGEGGQTMFWLAEVMHGLPVNARGTKNV